ncbi:unnamed protein product [Spodoptera littoralis]|uniref:Uncharacterized protein n=1 Tax=Spodoptera littoralis TaxID=7109 RepID=A0A9P0IBJ6_SPOLI|nr:unnamed protein product [Spodoptera littoralis]CAH1643705.1 unnamed protein product [Spodoptera littoralis]
MWLLPTILYVLYVETYQQDIVIPPILMRSRSRHAAGYPTGINVNLLSSRYNGRPNDMFDPYSPPSHYSAPHREDRPSEDLARLNYLVGKHERYMNGLVKSRGVSYEDDDISSYRNGKQLFSDEDDRDNLHQPKAATDDHSYYDDLDLVEHFGNYLIQKTEINSPSDEDAGRQYNALLIVLIALAKIIKNTCTDVEGVYDMVYLPTVEKFYSYGLKNADKVLNGIEEYIRRGNARIPKLLKLKKEKCEEHSSCAAAVNEDVRNNFIIYSKEIEMLESIVYLAQSFRDFRKEFSNAATTGSVLPYLQNNKDRIREYIWNVVSSIDHINGKVIKCP